MWRVVVAFARSDARRAQVYPAAALVGVLAFVIAYGAGHLIGSSSYWSAPQQDEAMAMMGYRYLLHEAWHWPVFVSDAVNVPYPKSVAFLDCIPIWALLNKALASLVPAWTDVSERAYVGLWHGLVYALQPCLGLACMRALGHRSWRAAAITTAMLLALPTWIARYGHPALSAHWIELWALYLYLRTSRDVPMRGRVAWSWLAQLAVAALVSPYHVALSFPIFLVSLLKTRRRRTAWWLPLGLGVPVGALWFAGYFASEITRKQWGFHAQSANLLGWLVPQRSGIVGDAQWIVSANGTPWQWEGYSYLGLGLLGLTAIALAHGRAVRGVIARHPGLFAVAVAATIFALSNHIYLGPYEIASYKIPRVLRWVTQQFRSPGRFVWIPSYVLLLYVLHWSLSWATSRRRLAIVSVAAVLQLVDATGEWSAQRAITTGPRVAFHDREGWRRLIHAHGAVQILPPYSCVNDPQGQVLDDASRQIQLLASERALPINGTYSARDLRRCAEEEAAWPTLALEPGTLHVLLPPAFAVATRFASEGAACGAFAHGRVCSTNAALIANAIAAGTLTALAGE